MNRSMTDLQLLRARVPRTRGDEPPADIVARHFEERSPHPRG